MSTGFRGVYTFRKLHDWRHISSCRRCCCCCCCGCGQQSMRWHTSLQSQQPRSLEGCNTAHNIADMPAPDRTVPRADRPLSVSHRSRAMSVPVSQWWVSTLCLSLYRLVCIPFVYSAFHWRHWAEPDSLNSGIPCVKSVSFGLNL